MQVQVVYYRNGAETTVAPGEAERQAMADRYLAALVEAVYPGARVRRRTVDGATLPGRREPGC